MTVFQYNLAHPFKGAPRTPEPMISPTMITAACCHDEPCSSSCGSKECSAADEMLVLRHLRRSSQLLPGLGLGDGQPRLLA